MHTPDSRIRADWTLPAETAAPPPTVAPDTPTTTTPDTSTTAGKVAVMQHAETHGASSIECRKKSSYNKDRYSRLTCDTHDILWNWEFFDYRIAPPPVPRTALQAAREFRAGIKTVDVTSPAGRLCALLSQIDSSIEVNIDGPPGGKKAVHWGFADLSTLTPGRYRLVRDDA